MGIIEKHTFANVVVASKENKLVYLGEKRSKDLYNHLKEEKYIDDNGKVTDKLKRHLKDNVIEVPDGFKECETQVVAVIEKIGRKS